MSEFNPIISLEEFKGMGIFDEKPQVTPNTARVYLGTGDHCAVFSSGSNITRSELMAGQYTNVYVIDLREFQKIWDQPLGSSDDLAGFTVKITMSLRITRPGSFARSMIKDVIRLVQQKLTPYLEAISMNYSPEKSQDLQREFLELLSKTTFQESLEKDYGIFVSMESILVRPDSRAMELIQQNRSQQEEYEKAIKKMEEDFTLQMARQKKEAEIKLAEMENQFKIMNKEAALKLKKPQSQADFNSREQPKPAITDGGAVLREQENTYPQNGGKRDE